MPIPVHLAALRDYAHPDLARTAGRLLELAGCRPARGDVVLVKPNLVAPSNPGLACTNPLVVRAACAYLLDCGARVLVGDSPAFGTGRIVAARAGLDKALRVLPVRLVNLGRPRPVPLRRGGRIGVSALALDADLVVSLPRFKVHGQMLLTLAVKNFFGCVTGMRKALAHMAAGQGTDWFASLILDVCLRLTPSVSLVDGVVAMHRDGPARGAAYRLGLLGACADPVALDTALYTVLGLDPERAPLGREALARDLPGARLAALAFPLLGPRDFASADFELPGLLTPVPFKPGRFILGRLKSLGLRLAGRGTPEDRP